MRLRCKKNGDSADRKKLMLSLCAILLHNNLYYIYNFVFLVVLWAKSTHRYLKLILLIFYPYIYLVLFCRTKD